MKINKHHLGAARRVYRLRKKQLKRAIGTSDENFLKKAAAVDAARAHLYSIIAKLAG